MKNCIALFIVFITVYNSYANKNSIQQNSIEKSKTIKDTTKEDINKEDETIEEIIKTRSKTKIKKEKIEYISQVTKYGFKNLYTNNTYNAALPYSSQINQNAIGFTQSYMKTHGNYLVKMKGWGQPYFNLIENVLQQYGLPKELKYIAVIESNLSAGATSRVGAGGPWQFMPYTARDYGLIVNSVTDDRRDYYKSTHAAAKYLLSLYKKMHDWLLVMAAYNGGPGRVYNAIKKSGSRDFWQLQNYLPEESRTYVKRFIATQYIMEGTGTIAGGGNEDIASFNEVIARTNYAHNSTVNPYDAKPKLSEKELIDIEVLPISGKYNSLVIAKNLSLDIAQFNKYNPNFDKAMASSGNFDLRLPTDKMTLFVANKYQILNECVQILYNSTSIIQTNKTVYKKSKRKKH